MAKAQHRAMDSNAARPWREGSAPTPKPPESGGYGEGALR